MKIRVIFFSILAVVSTDATSKGCRILTSQPDYSNMRVVTADSRWQSIPVVGGKPMKYIPFSDAYERFFKNLMDGIRNDCIKHKSMKGVVNLRVNYSVTEKWYHFSATYDVFE